MYVVDRSPSFFSLTYHDLNLNLNQLTITQQHHTPRTVCVLGLGTEEGGSCEPHLSTVRNNSPMQFLFLLSIILHLHLHLYIYIIYYT
jgi:hypothetical protein